MWRLFFMFLYLFFASASGRKDSLGEGLHMGNDNNIQTDDLREFTGHISWISWKELVRSTTAARCTMLSNDTYFGSAVGVQKSATDIENSEPGLSSFRSASFNKLCHIPIMLLFHKGDCPGCNILLQKLGNSTEFELLSDYMTMVAAHSVEEMIIDYPYPRPYLKDDMLLLSESRKKEKKLKGEKADAVRKALAGQGEYFPRIYFLFSHNGSVMPIVNQGSDSDSMHLHFYLETTSLLRSMMLALQTMNEAVDFSEL